jgi:diguanylate cyclase (GGDEF)-like protein
VNKASWFDDIYLSTLIEMRDCVSGLTKLDFSLYDGTASLLVPPISQDQIMEAFCSSREGKEEQGEFVKNGIQKAILRKNPSVFKGPMNQYHFFIPAQIGNIGIVLLGNAFYTSKEDLFQFFAIKGSRYGVSIDHIPIWIKNIVLSSMGKVSETCENIHRLFNLLVRVNYGKNITAEKYRRIATFLELFSEIDMDCTEEKLYQLLAEAIMFLFGGNTVSVMSRGHERFIPVITMGSFKNQVASVSLSSDAAIISDAIKNKRSFVGTDQIELLRLGYPDAIVSLYIFPLSIQGETHGLLGVFNSQFSEEELDTLSRLCCFAAFLLRTIISQKILGTHINGLTNANYALNLRPAFQDPETLYQSIVEVSSNLVSAERASLMLPEEANKELLIKAVRGMNKCISKNIRVTVGVGIAGRVFVEGKPLIVTDIESQLSMQKRPNYRTRSFVSIPLKMGDEAIGVLNLADRVDDETFSESDMVFLQYFTSCASIAIKGAQCYQKSEEMRTLSITDSLTRLFNRRYFDERLLEELQRAIRYDSPFSLAILDIDDFKLFNDTEGHIAGDEILKTIADIARKSIRSIDIIARFEDEKFSLIMPETESEEAFLVLERVRINIKDLIPSTWKNFPREKITVSMGMTTFPEDGKDVKTLIKNVDKALYRAKLQGKDRTVVWNDTDAVTDSDAI